MLKTYVLLESLRPSAPIFYQVSPTERVKMDKVKEWYAFLTSTFTDEKGKNRTARLKLNANSIWQDEQIKDGIPANEKFTNAEREAVKFKMETLMTTNPIVQEYLENTPQMAGFKGQAPNGERPSYRLLNKEVEVKADNQKLKKRLAAANKIMDLDLEGAQNLLIRINGSFFTPPATLEEAQNVLVDYLDEVDEAVEKILKEEVTIDDEVNVLIGRLVGAKVLSFVDVPDQVARRKGNTWINLKEISSSHPILERQRYFAEFLTSDAGKLLLDDLNKEAEKLLEKSKK